MRKYLLLAAAILFTGVLATSAQVPGVNSTLNSVFTLAYDNSTMKASYSASGAFVPPASATDVCTLTGSATKNVRVRRVLLSGIADAVQTKALSVIKRSTANSGGTVGTSTTVPYDSQFAAGTAVMRVYTANPTTGTSIGIVADPLMTWGNLTTGVGGPPLELKFGELASPVILRGTAQVLAVNLGGTSYTTPVLSCTIEWTEE